MKRIVILTGSELRHTFVRKYIAQLRGVELVASYCEGLEKSLQATVTADTTPNSSRLQHLRARERSEQDFFGAFVATAADRSNPISLPKGEINNATHTRAIIECNPDLIISYGC